MAPLIPPQAPPTWKRTAPDVDKLITEALERKKKVSDDIVKLPEDKLDFDSVRTVLRLSRTPISQPLYFRCL